MSHKYESNNNKNKKKNIETNGKRYHINNGCEIAEKRGY